MNTEFMLNEKFVKILCKIICAVYIFFAISFIFVYVNNVNNKERYFNEMVARAEEINKKIEDNLFFKDSNKNDEISTEPLFSDGVSAIISAYNKTLKSNSFIVDVQGDMTTSVNALGANINVKVATSSKVIKYNNNKDYETMFNKLMETNAPGIIQGFVNESSNKAYKTLRENGVINEYKTNKVYFQNNIVEADFAGCNINRNVNKKLIIDNLYIVNEKTVLKCNYFKVNYKNGVPKNYYVQIDLDAKESAKNYAKVLEQNSNALELPKYESLSISAVIDAKGYVTSMIVSEKTIIKMDTLGGTYCPCSSTYTYIISGVNEQITFNDEMF